MKKAIMFLAILTIGISLNAQETDTMWDDYPWTLGGGAMYDHNSRVNFALGYGVALERYLFTPYAALGLRATLHTDFDMVTNTEAAINFRAYKKAGNGALFAQWGFGYALYLDEDRNRSTYIMDFSAGYRLYLGRFFIEPYARIGYPFVIGAGFSAGRQFNF